MVGTAGMRWMCLGWILTAVSAVWVWDPEGCRQTNNLTAPCLGHFSYAPDGEPLYGDECGILRAKGVREIGFCGDSYMRQVYIAFLQRMLQNTNAASTDPSCQYGEQSKSSCKDKIRMRAAVCNGEVEIFLSSLETSSWCVPWAGPRPEIFASSSLVVWSGGNHPVDNDYWQNTGMYDADVVTEFKLMRFCARWNEGVAQRVIWMSAHASLEWAGFPMVRHTNEQVGEYEATIKARLREVCGVTRYVDTFTMTHSAIWAVDDVDDFNYDGRHWSQEMNLLKVELLLREIARAADGEFAGSEEAELCQGSGEGQCLHVLKPSPGQILNHRLAELFYLAFEVRVGCFGAEHALGVEVRWGNSSHALELEELAEHASVITLAIPKVRRFEDRHFTVTVLCADGSEELYRVSVDYGPDAPAHCACDSAEAPCHTIHW